MYIYDISSLRVNGVKNVISLLLRREVHPVFCLASDSFGLGHGAWNSFLLIGSYYFTDRNDRAI